MQKLSCFFASVVAVCSVSGCTAERLCEKVRQCQEEENDIELEDDSTRVCIEQFNGGIAVLRANDEEDCQKLADAQINLANCLAGLDCDDLFSNDDEPFDGECEDQVDELQDAQEDAAGLQCTSFD